MSMSVALPQSVGVGGVAGTIVGTILMTYAGWGEAAVYVCGGLGACFVPLIVAKISKLARRASGLHNAKDRRVWRSARMAAFGR